MLLLLIYKINNSTNPSKVMQEQKNNLFDSISKNLKVNINKYSVYGTHLNLEGTVDILKISGIKITYVEVVLKNLKGDEIRNRNHI